MKIIITLLVVIFLSGCAATDMQTKLERGLGNIPATQFSNAQTVEEIRKLRPQATVPLKIAVISQNRRKSLSQPERNIVEQLGGKLKQIGFAHSLELIPQSLQPTCGYGSDQNCFLNASRAAGARLGADTILFLNESAVTDAYVNPLSILNLTIVGMWVIPAHHRDSYSVYEASLFDIDNGYLYAVAEGHGENKIIRPYMYVEYETGRDEASERALNDISNRLYIIAQEQMKNIAAPSK